MFKNTKLALILSLMMSLVLSLTGCAFDKDDSKTNQAEVEARLKLLEKFNRVKGTYVGKLTTPTAVQDVSLNIFIQDVPNGTNTNGDTTYRVALKGNYKKLNPVGPGYNLLIRYTAETAEIIMSNEAANSGNGSSGTNAPMNNVGPDDIVSINAKISGQKILGTAFSNSGAIGTLDLALAADQSEVSGDNQQQEYYDRLFRQYESAAGVYEGANVIGGKASFTFKITLQVIKRGNIPYLIGQYDRDDDPNRNVSLNLVATYQPELQPPQLTLVGKPLFSGPNSSYEGTFTGILQNDQYQGSWKTNVRGFEGDFVLKKRKP